jgi:GNAT superfamily N-acetyltransferase
VWSCNELRVDAEVEPDQLAAALDDLYAGYPHRRALVERADTGARLAGAMRRRGWLVQHDLFMAHRRPPDRRPAPGLAREVDEAALRAVEAATFREEPYGEPEVIEQLLTARSAMCAAADGVRFFVGAVDGVDACHTTLYSDGGVAQVEDVATLGAFRRRGLARATVSAAIAAALEMGHELVFIVADDDDWPKDLYARLGFDPVGAAWGFIRPGPEHPAHRPAAAA